MTSRELTAELKSSQEFFERSSRLLTEQDSEFRPKEGMYTAAQQVAHAAQTIDWFVEGASRPDGFDLDFERHVAAIAPVTSLAEAREWLKRSYDSAQKYFGGLTETDLNKPLPAGPIMGGEPVWRVVYAISEHSAHHRGALSVYSRLLGKVPPMPYGDF
jgi:uncharacterized damage-inducible protein DinB